jgi:hypothetical protein
LKPYSFRLSHIFSSKEISTPKQGLQGNARRKSSILGPVYSYFGGSHQSSSDSIDDSSHNSPPLADSGTAPINLEQDSDSYFCSELVAAGLKVLGVLGSQLNAPYFWPGSFGSGDILDKEILSGFVYGPEVLIDCRVVEVASAFQNGHLVASDHSDELDSSSYAVPASTFTFSLT